MVVVQFEICSGGLRPPTPMISTLAERRYSKVIHYLENARIVRAAFFWYRERLAPCWQENAQVSPSHVPLKMKDIVITEESVTGSRRRVIAGDSLSPSAASLTGQVAALVTGTCTCRVLEVVAIGLVRWCHSVLLYFSLLINPGREKIARCDVAWDPCEAGH